jgi:hypothetical protein
MTDNNVELTNTQLEAIYEKNESAHPYQLENAGTWNSGYSFGVPQYDLSEGLNMNLFRQKATVSDLHS